MLYIHLRYGWTLPNISDHCVCGESFSPDHAMICCHGGLTFVHHNEIRDITAEWLERVYIMMLLLSSHCSHLQKRMLFQPPLANRQDDARVDIHACGFWPILGSPAE